MHKEPSKLWFPLHKTSTFSLFLMVMFSLLSTDILANASLSQLFFVCVCFCFAFFSSKNKLTSVLIREALGPEVLFVDRLMDSDYVIRKHKDAKVRVLGFYIKLIKKTYCTTLNNLIRDPQPFCNIKKFHTRQNKVL